jgi:hypothetical protein
MATRSTKKSVAEAAESKARKARATTLYPKMSLIDALRLAESIRDTTPASPTTESILQDRLTSHLRAVLFER